jgi:hypothetical protein
MKKEILMALLAAAALVGCERSDSNSTMNEPAGSQNSRTNRSSGSSGQSGSSQQQGSGAGQSQGAGQGQTGGANQSGGGTSGSNP